jgi:hypothetical protein
MLLLLGVYADIMSLARAIDDREAVTQLIGPRMRRESKSRRLVSLLIQGQDAICAGALIAWNMSDTHRLCSMCTHQDRSNTPTQTSMELICSFFASKASRPFSTASRMATTTAFSRSSVTYCSSS